MNIHLPAILMFTRGRHIPTYVFSFWIVTTTVIWAVKPSWHKIWSGHAGNEFPPSTLANARFLCLSHMFSQNTANTSGECWMGWVVAGMQDDPSLNVFEAPGPQSPVKRLRCLWHGFALHQNTHCHRPLREELHPWIWTCFFVDDSWQRLTLDHCWLFGLGPKWYPVGSKVQGIDGDWWGLCCDHFLSLNPHFLWLDHHFLWLNTALNQH